MLKSKVFTFLNAYNVKIAQSLVEKPILNTSATQNTAFCQSWKTIPIALLGFQSLYSAFLFA